MFFAKGEIIMNNIYKVIWSKAKNCYVVASEIARSHTKSASGSEKIGGVTRRSLLAALMALSLLCGGLGVASAVDVVHVNESAPGTAEVYTKTGVDNLLAEYGKKEAVETNKNNIATLQTTTMDHGQKIATNTADIANNKAAIDKKIDTATANATFATKEALDSKADKNTVTALDGRVGDVEGKVTALETTVGDASIGLVKAVNDLKTQGNDLNNALGSKADQNDLDAATNRISTNEGNITALQTKTAKLSDDGTELNGMTTVGTGALKVTGGISNGTGVTTTLDAIDASMKQTVTNKDDIDTLKTTTNGQQTAIGKLNEKTTQISYDAAKGTTVNEVEFKAAEVDAHGKRLTGVTTLNTTGDATVGGELNATGKVSGKGLDAGTEAITGGSLSVTGAVNGSSVNAGTLSTTGNATVGGELNATGKVSGKGLDAGTEAITGGSLSVTGAVNGSSVNAGTLSTTGNATVGGELNATGKVSGKGLDAGTEAITGGSLSVTGAVNGSSVNAGTLSTTGNATVGGELNATGKVSGKGLDAGTEAITGGSLSVTGAVNGSSVNTGTLNTTGDATVGGDLSAKNTEITGTLHAIGETKLDDKLTVEGEATFKENVTMEKDLEVKGELKTDKISMKNTDTDADGWKHDSATTITADGITHIGEVEKSGVITKSQFTHTEEGSETYAKKGDTTNWTETRSDVKADGVKTEVKDSEGNRTNTSQTADGIKGYATDKAGNKTYTKVTATENSFQVQDKDGKNKNHQVNTMDSSVTEIKNEAGATTKTEQTAENITNTAQNGTITNDANHIVNKANTMDTTVTGKATESYGELDTTVNRQATENFNGGLNTKVTGAENHTVTGKQTNTVEGGQENIISGGQTNTITGGQINNITGDQTTTITGNKKETVTENVTEDYKKDLTTTVGGNEIHDVKGTKTETVEGKLTENFKDGQETNVSGTQTINATDINRNASSGMIDTVDNAYGTNKETKVAGSTTTEVSIKGTRESGTYIRGATEARDYIIKGTLSNSETKTAEATSTEITDGNGKTSATIQDKTQISGSVTNGTSSAVSNVKADSIDTAVKEGTNTSLISQKKDSITSAVGNGTTSTVIQQGDKDITIASNGGTVGIVGKDIINNATDEITNTAGTKITDKVGNNTRVIDQTSITDTVGTASRKIEDGKITDIAGDSTVTTENGKGTTFAKAGSAAYSTEVGAPTDTNIAGNLITTGRVNANELDVSDTDGNNKADLLVKAGEGVKASASDGNTTGSLDVKADGITTSITNGTDHNTVSSTLAGGTIFTNSEAAAPVTGASGAGTAVNTTIKGNTITTGKVTMDYADVMKDLGVRGNAKVDNDLTVKGITNTKTLNVTEDANVGRDLAVGGNATIAGDVTARSYKVDGKTYIDANGIHANDQKITDVADGSISEGSKDAVNGGQLYGVKRDLEHQVDKVGANAAAMANLRPMEFDPSSKWNIAAAIGNYGSETAAALGAFYRPNDDVMVNLSTAFGTGENMVGGGVSVRLGKGGNKLSREENNALKDQVNDLTARMDALLSVLNPNMSKDFPDVPENHWAYEAVSRLAGNDIVQGYPDGEFHGERTMTRYEMAEIIYNALSRGAEAEKELVEEFKPELQAMAASEKATAEKAEG